MKTLSICLLLLALSSAMNAQSQFTNNGSLRLHAGTTISFFGDFVNNGSFSDTSATSRFVGASPQTIGGTSVTAFDNLVLDNSSSAFPEFSFGNDVQVQKVLDMQSGNVNLNGNSLTLGTSGTSAGDLSYTAGSLYGGEMVRWFADSVLVIGNTQRGLYPMGTNMAEFRPAWIAWSSVLASPGTVGLSHDPAYPIGIIPGSFLDPTWGDGTQLQAVSKASWDFSPGAGFGLSGTTGSIRFGGEGFGQNDLFDINASLLSSVTGTYLVGTQVGTLLEANREGLATTDLGNAWYIGTRDTLASPLPVVLTSFYAKCEAEGQRVVWSTASEQGSDIFSVERSNDGQSWGSIGTGPGAGYSSAPHSYSLQDHQPVSWDTYYRLSHVNTDGSTLTYSTISAGECGTLPDFTVYPNPSSGIVHMIVEGDKAVLSLEVFDMMGKQVYSSNSFPSILDLQSHPSGLYSVCVMFPSTAITRRLVIER